MGNKPQILFIATACPFGTSGSGKRTVQTINALSKIGNLRLVFATDRIWTKEQLHNTTEVYKPEAVIHFKPAPMNRLLQWIFWFFDKKFLKTHGVRATRADLEKIKTLAEQSDIVWIHTYKPANAFGIYKWPKTVMDADDYPSGFNRSAMMFEKKLKSKVRRRIVSFLWSRQEKQWKDRFNCICVCKNEDRSHFGNDENVFVIPNSVASILQTENFGIKKIPDRLGMLGDFEYLANKDGLIWFIGNVWPQIKKHRPDVHLRLVGKGSESIAKEIGDSAIAGLGYVDDLNAEMFSWVAMIAPSRIGGGSSVKVADGLVRRIPLIATRHGVRGYPLENGKSAIISDDPKELSEACCEILNNESSANKIGEQGYMVFNGHCSEPVIFKRIEQAVLAIKR